MEIKMNIMREIIQDKNINIDERYMLVLLNSLDCDEDNVIEITLNTLAKQFYISTKRIISSILKSLERKCYIQIVKITGCVNKYKLLKSAKDNDRTSRVINTTTSIDISVPNYIEVPSAIKVPSDIEVYGTQYKNVTTAIKVPSTSAKNVGGGSYLQDTSVINVPSTGAKNVGGGSYLQDTTAIKVPSTGVKNVGGSSYLQDTSALEVPSSIDLKVLTTEGDSLVEQAILQGLRGDIQCENSSYSINNNINNNIYNNNIYINILNTWNSININPETSLNNDLTNTIKNTLKLYSFEQIITAIQNYSRVYESKHYYNHRWNLYSFLCKPNGISRFMDNGDIWLEYKAKYYSYYDSLKDNGINYEDYIG